MKIYRQSRRNSLMRKVQMMMVRNSKSMKHPKRMKKKSLLKLRKRYKKLTNWSYYSPRKRSN